MCAAAQEDADPIAAMRADVWASLNRPQKTLSPKYFYDARGSELFDRVTELEEYYLTRTECALLVGFGAPWIASLGAATLVELGPGNAAKARLLLDALDPAHTVYVPVDISSSYLAAIGTALAAEYAGLSVRALCADISKEFRIPAGLPEPTVVAFLGSTIGNFQTAAAVRLLGGIAAALRPTDRLLLGVDLDKDPAVLERAYNDATGLTAEFNRNVLLVLNERLGTDFDATAFEHVAFYDEAARRIEMHLAARRPQRVRVPGCGTIGIEAGETILTEISTKYDRDTVADMFLRSGLALEQWVPDRRNWFALAIGVAAHD